jgi:hypothetical protein
VINEVKAGEDPLDLAVLSDGRILARSLASGELLQAHL